MFFNSKTLLSHSSKSNVLALDDSFQLLFLYFLWKVTFLSFNKTTIIVAVLYWKAISILFFTFYDAPLHLLGRTHPFVREALKKVASVSVPEPREPKPKAELQPEFPFYYEDYAETYHYDDQAYVDDGIPNVLPIINQRTDPKLVQPEQKRPFLPTPLPIAITTARSQTLVTADPLPLTTMKVETSTTSTTTITTTTATTTTVVTTTSTTVPTTLLGDFSLT